MINLGGDVGFSGDGEELVERFEELVSLAAQMRDVDASMFSSGAGEGYQLIRLRVETWRVDQRGADANRAFLHRLLDELGHAPELVGCRCTIGVTQLMHAHRRTADERRDVARDAAFLQMFQVAAERGPLHVVADVALLRDEVLLHLRIERAHRLSFTHHFERHALADVALRTPIVQQ